MDETVYGRHLRRPYPGAPAFAPDDVEPRSEQPCWCPDAFRDAALWLDYCPQHGSHPDPELWDHDASPYPEEG